MISNLCCASNAARFPIGRFLESKSLRMDHWDHVNWCQLKSRNLWILTVFVKKDGQSSVALQTWDWGFPASFSFLSSHRGMAWWACQMSYSDFDGVRETWQSKSSDRSMISPPWSALLVVAMCLLQRPIKIKLIWLVGQTTAKLVLGGFGKPKQVLFCFETKHVFNKWVVFTKTNVKPYS